MLSFIFLTFGAPMTKFQRYWPKRISKLFKNPIKLLKFYLEFLRTNLTKFLVKEFTQIPIPMENHALAKLVDISKIILRNI
jgi:hypothetical protein